MSYQSPITPAAATAASGVAAVPARQGFSFTALWRAGYHDILPLLPHDAPLTPNSKIDPADLGKVPGQRVHDHAWRGFVDWPQHVTTEADCQVWDLWDCGIGAHTVSLVAVDIDHLHSLGSQALAEAATAVAGAGLVRVGQAPKQLLVYRCDAPLRGFRLSFELFGRPGLVEVLAGRGHHFVLTGIHPRTGRLYDWPNGTPLQRPYSSLPLIDQDTINRLHDRLKAEIENVWGGKITADSVTGQSTAAPGSAINELDLAPDGLTVQAVVDLLDRLPNPASVGREPYVSAMQSLAGCRRGLIARGALQAGSEEDDALANAAAAWEARWEGMPEKGLDRKRDHAAALEKWNRDWIKRGDRCGWRHLLEFAGTVDPDQAKAAAAENAQWQFEADQTAPEEQGRPALGDMFMPPPLPPPPDRNALLAFMDINAWAHRDIPPADRLLGDLITTTSRTFLVGRTGLGKTQMAVGMAAGIATGTGFLHWQSSRKGRVLLIDGEMSAVVIKGRMQDAIRRCGGVIEPGAFWVYAMDLAEEFATAFPGLGHMAPLNTPAGQQFVLKLVDIIKPDVVILDNVMSLVSGDQKDEIPWTETMPLVLALTRKRIGQVWLDHTGHNSDRQYGSSTKAWRFDSVALMTPLSEKEGAAEEWETAFRLSFDHPGKARMRSQENWRDFREVVVRLTGDNWTYEAVRNGDKKAETLALTPTQKGWLKDIQAIFAEELAKNEGRQVALGQESVSLTLTRETIRKGLQIRKRLPDGNLTHASSQKMSDYCNALKDKGYLEIDGEEFRLV